MAIVGLEPGRSDGHQVPGTVVLLDGEDDRHIALNPRPSDDPRDPLVSDVPSKASYWKCYCQNVEEIGKRI